MMSKKARLLIGFVAVLLLGWVHHGPLGNGQRFVDRLERQAKQVAVVNGLPQVEARGDRAPLARAVTLSGAINDFQRQGMGSYPGLTARVGSVPGMAQVRWADDPESGGFTLPLLLESLLMMTFGYAIGIGIAWRIDRRKRRTRYA